MESKCRDKLFQTFPHCSFSRTILLLFGKSHLLDEHLPSVTLSAQRFLSYVLFCTGSCPGSYLHLKIAPDQFLPMSHISPLLAFAPELFAKPKVWTFSQGAWPSFTTPSADALAPESHKSRVHLSAGAFRLRMFGSCEVSQIPHLTQTRFLGNAFYGW